jgi:hypothetical protein
MTVKDEHIVQILAAVLQAKIAAAEQGPSVGASGSKPTVGKLVADSIAVTKEAVAALKSGEGF